MELRANAYKEYGEVAVTKLMLDSLPQIARNVSAPLTKIDDIVIVGSGGKAGAITSETTKLLAELPVLVVITVERKSKNYFSKRLKLWLGTILQASLARFREQKKFHEWKVALQIVKCFFKFASPKIRVRKSAAISRYTTKLVTHSLASTYFRPFCNTRHSFDG